jgi:hypothetical protein
MSSSQYNQSLDRVLRAWLDRSIERTTFVSEVFENLTPDNLHIFLRLVSSRDLEMLKSEAANAPTTEQGWERPLCTPSSLSPAISTLEQPRRDDKDSKARYRRGVETLRQSLE